MKLSLSGLIGYLQGKGWKLHVNEDADAGEDAFEIVEEPAVVSPATLEEAESPDEMLSAEELAGLKKLASILAKNNLLLESLENGNLEKAITTVPAAAQLVANAAAREKAEKDQVITTIKANGSNVYSDDELESMPLPVLVKLNAQMKVNYTGLGGGNVIQNNEQPLVLPQSLLTQAQEVKNGS